MTVLWKHISWTFGRVFHFFFVNSCNCDMWTWSEMSYSSNIAMYKACSLVLGTQSQLNLCFSFSSLKWRWNVPCKFLSTWFCELWRIANVFYLNKSSALWIINMLYNAGLEIEWDSCRSGSLYEVRKFTNNCGSSSQNLKQSSSGHNKCFITAVQLGFHGHMILSTCSLTSINQFIYNQVSLVNSFFHIADCR